MAKGFIFFIIGVLLIIAKWKKFIVIDVIWIIGCFVLWLVVTFVSVHKKNKERNIPKPVYLAKQ